MIVGSNNFQRSLLKIYLIIKILGSIYCNRLHAWWSTKSRLATLLSSLFECLWVELQTLWRFRFIDLFCGEMVGACCFVFVTFPNLSWSTSELRVRLEPWNWFKPSGQPGFTCWISLAPVFTFMYCWVLIFATSSYFSLINMFLEMMHWWVRGHSCKPNIYVYWSTSEIRVGLALWNRFKPPSKSNFYWPFQGCASFVDRFC